MDIKKSRAADLESRRTTFFLLGLVLVLAAVFVALEYNDMPESADDFDFDVDDMPAELDFKPRQEDEDRIALITTRLPPATATKIKVVDDVRETAPNDKPVVEKDGEKEGEGDDERQGNGVIDRQATEDQAEALLPPGTDPKNNPEHLRIAEDLPVFPGGPVELMKWLTKNLRYPQDAQRQKVQGEVRVQFVVGKDGKLTAQKVVKSLNPSCDREALRVIRMMPDWKPGVQDGKPCRTMVCIPIVFKL